MNMEHTQMKDSDIEWIGKIPEDWKIKRLKLISKVELSTVDRHENNVECQVSICHYPIVYKNEKITKNTKLDSGTCSRKELGRFNLKKDDVLVTKDSETSNDIGVPAYVIEDMDNSVCGYHLAQISTDKTQLLGSFLFRYLQTELVSNYFETESHGITCSPTVWPILIIFPVSSKSPTPTKGIPGSSKGGFL